MFYYFFGGLCQGLMEIVKTYSQLDTHLQTSIICIMQWDGGTFHTAHLGDFYQNRKLPGKKRRVFDLMWFLMSSIRHWNSITLMVSNQLRFIL